MKRKTTEFSLKGEVKGPYRYVRTLSYEFTHKELEDYIYQILADHVNDDLATEGHAIIIANDPEVHQAVLKNIAEMLDEGILPNPSENILDSEDMYWDNILNKSAFYRDLIEKEHEEDNKRHRERQVKSLIKQAKDLGFKLMEISQ